MSLVYLRKHFVRVRWGVCAGVRYVLAKLACGSIGHLNFFLIVHDFLNLRKTNFLHHIHSKLLFLVMQLK